MELTNSKAVEEFTGENIEHARSEQLEISLRRQAFLRSVIPTSFDYAYDSYKIGGTQYVHRINGMLHKHYPRSTYLKDIGVETPTTNESCHYFDFQEAQGAFNRWKSFEIEPANQTRTNVNR